MRDDLGLVRFSPDDAQLSWGPPLVEIGWGSVAVELRAGDAG